MIMGKTRLWRVDVIHVDGYHAPYILSESTTDRLYQAEAEAIKLARENSRLSMFPCWKFVATRIEKKKLNDKWYSEDEYYFKISN